MACDYRHARKHLIPIDAIDFSFEVTKIVDDKELDENGPPEDGCYMRGLFVSKYTTSRHRSWRLIGPSTTSSLPPQ